jgi:hypothetical protein
MSSWYSSRDPATARFYRLPLNGLDLRSVRRAFAFAVKGPANTIDIDDVSIDLPALDGPRSIQS